ncbi:DUF418 domain-containing protein [Nocardiopsis sp. FIRDI 009]|uniref:DUF418 domain-containing protein n=1 Tax=Nocardiopsis sp. FIRDI 009 TaxID=714197 RepID=UPI0018E566DF|nr:DUF418 domain-containing protein [Nocardiopsis sp. FIRDI 009]
MIGCAHATLFLPVAFTLVFTPCCPGLGATLGYAGAAAVAVGTWFGTVALTEAWRQTGRSGPSEVLLRRLTYARTGHTPSQ